MMWNSYSTSSETTGTQMEWYSKEVLGSYVSGTPANAYNKLLICPAARKAKEGWVVGWEPPAPQTRASYFFNSSVIGYGATRVRYVAVINPSRCILAGEGRLSFERPFPSLGEWAKNYTSRWHSGGSHTLFVDGHVSWYSLPEGLENADVIGRWNQ